MTGGTGASGRRSTPGGLGPRSPWRAETGRRVVVRHLLDDGRATDVIGDLQVDETDSAAGFLEVLPDFGPNVRIAGDRLLARRDVPARTVRPSSSLPAVSRVIHQGWPGLERARLGGWIATASGGFTGRANCCLPLGDPGLPLEQAVDRVETFYAERGLPPRFQLSEPLVGSGREDTTAGLAQLLTARGYTADRPTVTMVADLRGQAPEPRGASGRDLLTSSTPDERWLRLAYPGASPPVVAVEVLCAAREQTFVTLLVHGRAVGCARLAVVNGWAGVTSMQVENAHRRRGHGRWLLEQLRDAARRAGARTAYLQVLASNEPASALYRAVGFVPHHTYRYLSGPQA